MTRRVRMGTLIEETLNLLRGQFLGGVELTTTFDPDLPAVEVSQGRLEQVLLNFVVNAAEAMNGRGRLELRAALATAATGCVKPPTGAGPWVELTVADSGPGIPADVLPRIFEPFYTTKNLGNQRGTGLGLATVWRLAEEEQFGLRVRTEPGRGTEFSVLVPVQKPTPSA
jgi:two-component system cell cycle sensor histidine kinase/response regulator CckA